MCKLMNCLDLISVQTAVLIQKDIPNLNIQLLFKGHLTGNWIQQSN